MAVTLLERHHGLPQPQRAQVEEVTGTTNPPTMPAREAVAAHRLMKLELVAADCLRLVSVRFGTPELAAVKDRWAYESLSRKL